MASHNVTAVPALGAGFVRHYRSAAKRAMSGCAGQALADIQQEYEAGCGDRVIYLIFIFINDRTCQNETGKK